MFNDQKFDWVYSGSVKTHLFLFIYFFCWFVCVCIGSLCDNSARGSSDQRTDECLCSSASPPHILFWMNAWICWAREIVMIMSGGWLSHTQHNTRRRWWQQRRARRENDIRILLRLHSLTKSVCSISRWKYVARWTVLFGKMIRVLTLHIINVRIWILFWVGVYNGTVRHGAGQSI